MTYAGMVRAQEATRRRNQRAAQQALRELERRAKEREKLSVLEQARLEVETYEKGVEVLLSVHKDQGDFWDWIKLASSLPPVTPQRNFYLEFKAKQRAMVLRPEQQLAADCDAVAAQAQDERLYQEARAVYVEEMTEWVKMTSLAKRILAGEHKAYIEALLELSPLTELADLGTSIHFSVHSAKLIECELKVNGKQAIPAEHKTLTASGKVSVKAMPKVRFHEIYQDYVCGCMLRVAREVFAVLPVDTVLITALADVFDPRTGRTAERPVVSAAMPRAIIGQLAFDRLDPSDSLENFQHRGDFKASRNSETFQPIIPLLPGDLTQQKSVEAMNLREVLTQAKSLRTDVQAMLTRLQPRAVTATT